MLSAADRPAPTAAPAKSIARTRFARLITLLAIAVLLSAARYNPWVDRMVVGVETFDRADVVGQYAAFAVVIGAVWLLLARRVARGPSRLDGPSMAILIVTAAVLADRFLLAVHGLPLWQYDAEVRFTHRPGAQRLVRRGAAVPLDGKDLVIIDEFGFHDRGVTLEKPPDQLRILSIGDSVSMGFGVTYDETFAKHLEDLLARQDARHASHQVINAGVHGYSTTEERIALERTLAFRPDLIVIGFCLNDVTEPYVIDTTYGGTGLDYHGVRQVPSAFAGWIANETGLGRWMQARDLAGKALAIEKRLEVYNVRAMAEGSRTAPEMIEAWKITLAEMDRIYEIAKKAGIPVVLAIFPFTFQLGHPELQEPQRILTEHAARHGVDVVDLTPAFEAAVQVGNAESRYFIDEDHLTGDGHLLVAERLHAYLVEKGLAGPR